MVLIINLHRTAGDKSRVAHRFFGAHMSYILEEKRKTPVRFKADVIVAGGGPAGLATALAAARNGAKTILVERYNCLGGLATAGLVITLPPPPAAGYRGILKEILEKLSRASAAHQFEKCDESAGIVLFNPEMLKLVADQMIEQAGVKLLLNSLVAGAVVEDNTVTGVIVENKSGRQAISGKVVVDATGDGDVAVAAGAPYKTEKKPLPMTLMYIIGGVDNDRVREYQRKDPKLCRVAKKAGFTHRTFGAEREEYRGPSFRHMDNIAKGQVVVWSGCIRADGTDVEDLTRAEVELRKRVLSEVEFLRKHVPGFENAHLAMTAPYIGVRETRRIVGEYILKEDGFRKVFRDAVAYQAYSAEPNRTYGIPYRCLLPKRVDNLLVAGRCFSATHVVQNKLREIPACMAMGQAAGTAAALSVRLGVKPKRLDVELLQETLMEQGGLEKV